jgi:hypothetical protein
MQGNYEIKLIEMQNKKNVNKEFAGAAWFETSWMVSRNNVSSV